MSLCLTWLHIPLSSLKKSSCKNVCINDNYTNLVIKKIKISFLIKTHFDKIINHLQDGKKSLLWLKDERLTSIDLMYVKQEVEFYILKGLGTIDHM